MKLLSLGSALALAFSPVVGGCAHQMNGSMMQHHSMMGATGQNAQSTCPGMNTGDAQHPQSGQSGMMGGANGGMMGGTPQSSSSGAMMGGANGGMMSGAPQSGSGGAMMGANGVQQNCPPSATTQTPPATTPTPQAAPVTPDDPHQGHHPGQ